MTKVVWLLNETDYSYCGFVAPNTPYSRTYNNTDILLKSAGNSHSSECWGNRSVCSIREVRFVAISGLFTKLDMQIL